MLNANSVLESMLVKMNMVFIQEKERKGGKGSLVSLWQLKCTPSLLYGIENKRKQLSIVYILFLSSSNFKKNRGTFYGQIALKCVMLEMNEGN